MTNRLALIVLLAFLWSGCACTKNAAKKPAKTTIESTAQVESEPSLKASESQPPEAQAKAEDPCPGKRMESKGKVTLKGQIGQTKGAQLMLKGVILNVDNRREAQQWVGKNVTATGDLCIYTCGPMEQCLMNGTIPSLNKITITETESP